MSTTNNEIDHRLRKFPNFLGAMPMNFIPPFLPPDTAIIVNLSNWYPHGKGVQGTHWVAAHNSPENVITFFDPFGVQPPLHLLDTLKNSSKKIFYSDQDYQPLTSENCGRYSSDFVAHALSGKLKQFLTQELRPVDLGGGKNNEKLVINFFKK